MIQLVGAFKSIKFARGLVSDIWTAISSDRLVEERWQPLRGLLGKPMLVNRAKEGSDVMAIFLERGPLVESQVDH